MIFSLLSLIDPLGALVLQMSETMGDFGCFVYRAIKVIVTTKPKFKQIIAHMGTIGVGSIPIIFLTGSFTGLALALQSYIGFHRLGAEEFIGLVVTLGMVRELGPVLTGLMITSRCGSAMAAEIGTMQITEQVDALKTININPMQYLIAPRIIAAMLIVPFLTIIAMFCGIVASYLFCTQILALNAEAYISIIQERTELSDIIGGLIKSAFFGLIIALIGTYYGYIATGGARGVGKATTKSVVAGSMLILTANYFLSSLLFQIGVS